MHLDPANKRSEVIKSRWKPEDVRKLRMEDRMAGMQLATYVHELANLGRRLGAADLLRELNGAAQQDKSA